MAPVTRTFGFIPIPSTPFGPCRACESRLRAERKAGQLLKKIEKNKGRDPVVSADRVQAPKTLPEHGITRDQSADCQKLDEIPADEFEEALAGPDMPTTSRRREVPH